MIVSGQGEWRKNFISNLNVPSKALRTNNKDEEKFEGPEQMATSSARLVQNNENFLPSIDQHLSDFIIPLQINF